MPTTDSPAFTAHTRERLESVVIRFAGDSGDGMQVVGARFTESTAQMGTDLATFPDFPAEIRAPTGTTYGVSGFQIHIAAHDILTPGDSPDVLVAMNPAALKVNLRDLRPGGLLVVNTGAFNESTLEKAGYKADPLTDGTLDPYAVLDVDISKLTLDAVKPLGLGARDALRCKNFCALGIVYWLFDRDREPTYRWLRAKFKARPDLADANIAALDAGHTYGESAELPQGVALHTVPSAQLPPGEYRNITGNEAVAWGLLAGAELAGIQLFLGTYPITPASTLLHALARLKHFGVTTFQAEDEIAAVCSAIGASFGGRLGVTSTSGPGLALKTEALGLAIATELPLVLVDIQRAGPSTGLPTKTEQSDLLQAVYGRNGDAPLAVLAAATPGECFQLAIEAVRIATQSMTPVILLSDGYIANGSEPWRIPDMASFERFPVQHRTDPVGFHPFVRDERLARAWAIPGTPGLEHRIGGIEKAYDSGNISYDSDNHAKMTWVRAEKIRRIADTLPHARTEDGDTSGDLLVVGWGSTYGSIRQAVLDLRAQGTRVAHLHLRHLSPLPHGLPELLKGFGRVLVPELNAGMLIKILRSEFLVPAQGLSKVAGQPFKVSEIVNGVRKALEETSVGAA